MCCSENRRAHKEVRALEFQGNLFAAALATITLRLVKIDCPRRIIDLYNEEPEKFRPQEPSSGCSHFHSGNGARRYFAFRIDIYLIQEEPKRFGIIHADLKIDMIVEELERNIQSASA